MPLVTVASGIQVLVDDNAASLGHWIPGTFAGALNSMNGCETLALILPRPVYMEIAENLSLIRASASVARSYRSLRKGATGLLQYRDLTRVKGAREILFFQVPASGPPRIAAAKATTSGFEITPAVAELRSLLSAPRLMSLPTRAKLRQLNSALRTESGFWFVAAPILACEWADSTLEDHIASGGALSSWGARDLLRFVRRMLRGLAALHRAGIMHGDLRPCNILCVGDPAKPRNYFLAEYGRFPSTAELCPTQHYFLPGIRDHRYSPPESCRELRLGVEVVATSVRANELRLVAGPRNAILGRDDLNRDDLFEPFAQPVANVLAIHGHSITCETGRSKKIVFDSKLTWTRGTTIYSRCHSSQWRVHGRMMVPSGRVARRCVSAESLSLMRRASAFNDLYGLGMVALDLLEAYGVNHNLLKTLVSDRSRYSPQHCWNMAASVHRSSNGRSTALPERDLSPLAVTLWIIAVCFSAAGADDLGIYTNNLLKESQDVEMGFATRVAE